MGQISKHDWRKKAYCLGEPIKVFFPHESHDINKYEEAKSFCVKCSVKNECLDLVINQEDNYDRWGVFGGLTPQERNHERRRRRFANG